MPERTESFGPELRRLRMAAGLTLDRLVGHVHYSKSHLSKVENGQQRPTPELARLCDVALGAGGALAALVPVPEVPARPSPSQNDGEVWLLRMEKNGSSRFDSVDRRQVAAAGAGSMLTLSLGGLPAFADEQGASLVDASRLLFAQFRRLGQTTAPGLLLPSLVAQTHAVEQMAQRSGGRTRGQLLAIAARFAEYTGWMAQESGSEEAALWWTDRAVELARAGADTHLAAYGLVRRGLVSLLHGDIAQATALTEQALNTQAPPRVRGLAAQQQAQGHALRGDHHACMRRLDEARELLGADDADSGMPVLGSAHVPDVVSMYTGWCLYHLGHPRRAAEILARECARIPEHAVRSRTRYGVRLALAYAGDGEVERACELLHPLLGQAGLVHSSTITSDVRRIARILGRHPRNSAVRALSPDLAAALATLPPPASR
ncbi:helix-turn-helix domain-containing protein [Streptomyces avicenniae]|uniref:helix-turn-helix domain-containing protein n=1 Tax=Streptomyces avicenniae TaxID=500153 RepID=UPI00069B044C|nr:helix-turn-helix domain-containing protein [Streptomyces avicenniae]